MDEHKNTNLKTKMQIKLKRKTSTQKPIRINYQTMIFDILTVVELNIGPPI